MSIHTIPWSKKYVRAIDNIFFQTWLDTYPNPKYNISQVDIVESFWKLTPRLKRRIIRLESIEDNEHRIIAKEWNKIIGLCVLKKDNFKNTLEALYVLPWFQGRWVGKKLWEDITIFFDKTLPIVTEVAIYNKNAIAFYEKLGFRRHIWEYHIKDVYQLKNWKSFPVITMILSHIYKK